MNGVHTHISSHQRELTSDEPNPGRVLVVKRRCRNRKPELLLQQVDRNPLYLLPVRRKAKVRQSFLVNDI